MLSPKKKSQQNTGMRTKNTALSRARTSIEWRLMGVHETEDDVSNIARRNKVSRRKTDELLSGSKVTYRCNAWKRTRCAYQIYALFNKEDHRVYVYEGGEHDHTGTRVPPNSSSQKGRRYQELALINPELQHALELIKEEPASSQMCNNNTDIKFLPYANSSAPGQFNMSDYLAEDVLTADPYQEPNMNQGNFAVKNLIEAKTEVTPGQQDAGTELAAPKGEKADHQQEHKPTHPTTSSQKTPAMPYPYPPKVPATMQQPLLMPSPQRDILPRNLPQNYLNFIAGRADLLQIAAEYNLSFQYSSDQEILFTNHEKTQSLLIRNCGDTMTVQLLGGPNGPLTYTSSADHWQAFLFSIRGLCLHFFYSSAVRQATSARSDIPGSVLSQLNLNTR